MYTTPRPRTFAKDGLLELREGRLQLRGLRRALG